MQAIEFIEKSWGALNALGQSLAIILMGIVLFFAFRRWGLKRLELLARGTTNDMDDSMVQFTRTFSGIVVGFVVLSLVLKLNGVSLGPLLAGAGIAGMALGFAAKETISDILAGIFLLIDRPIRVGDRVKLESIGEHWGAWGDVVDIGLRRTQVRNTDGVFVSYPNSMMASSVIINFSYDEKQQPVRVRVRFQVGYGADLDQVKALTLQAISSTEGVLPDSEAVLIRSLWDDERGHLLAGIVVEGRYRISDVRLRSTIRSKVLENLLNTLRRAGVPMGASQPPLVPAREPEPGRPAASPAAAQRSAITEDKPEPARRSDKRRSSQR